MNEDIIPLEADPALFPEFARFPIASVICIMLEFIEGAFDITCINFDNSTERTPSPEAVCEALFPAEARFPKAAENCIVFSETLFAPEREFIRIFRFFPKRGSDALVALVFSPALESLETAFTN